MGTEEQSACAECARLSVTDNVDAYSLGAFWTIEADVTGPGTRCTPNFLLTSRAHRQDLFALTAAERSELMRLLPQLFFVIKTATSAEGVALTYAEDAARPHLRFELRPTPPVHTLPGGPPTASAVASEVVRRVALEPPPPVAGARYAFVDAVVAGIDTIQHFSLYGPLLRWWSRNEDTNRRRAQVAPVYVLGWLTLSVIMLLSSQAWLELAPIATLCVLIASYRFLDIVLYQARLLLSRQPEQTVLAGFDRSLLFLTLNIIELTFLSGIWFRAAGLASTSGSWFAGFLLTTLISAPSKPKTLSPIAATGIDVATVATVCGALVLLVGGLGLLVSLISQRFHETPI